MFNFQHQTKGKKMKIKPNVIALISLILCISCEDNKNETEDVLPSCEVTISSADQGLVSILTCDVTDTLTDQSLYLNFVNGDEDTLDWHLSYRNIPVGGGYYMPSISMNSYIAVDSVTQFSDITSSPSPDAFVVSTMDIEYGGTHAALTYNMGTHTVSTSGLTYFAYLPMDNHRVFKIHFIEYSSGVLSFEYKEL